MDLVERYINTAKPFLPRAQRDDILAELSEAIHGRLDERAAELGRKLTTAEQEAVIREFGHPVTLAGRYGPQRTLIGPKTFPLWWVTVRLVVAFTFIGFLARAVATGIAAWSTSTSHILHVYGEAWSGFFAVSLTLIGAVTLTFGAIEWFDLDIFKDWQVKDLKPMTISGPKPKGRIENAFGLIFVLAFTLWWGALPFLQEQLPGVYGPLRALHGAGLEVALAWYPMIWGLVLASAIAEAIAHLIGVIDPQRRVGRGVFRILASAGSGAAAAVALQSEHLLSVATESALASASFGVEKIDTGLHIGAMAMVVFSVLSVAWELWKLVRKP